MLRYVILSAIVLDCENPISNGKPKGVKTSWYCWFFVWIKTGIQTTLQAQHQNQNQNHIYFSPITFAL